jgi:hypothetical protein
MGRSLCSVSDKSRSTLTAPPHPLLLAVPMDKPEASLQMINRWLAGKDQ